MVNETESLQVRLEENIVQAIDLVVLFMPNPTSDTRVDIVISQP